MKSIRLPMTGTPLFLGAWALLLVQLSAFGASICITGTVKDADGKAVGGAEVYAVADSKVKTTSGADGSFALSGSIPDVPGKTMVAAAAAKTDFMTAQILAPNSSAKGLQFKLYPSIIGKSVTLMGNRMSDVHLRDLAQWDPQNDEKKNGRGGKVRFVFLLAFEGPPGIKEEVDQIWNDYHPGSSIDGDSAKELEDQFRARMMYYLDGPMVDEKFRKANNYGKGILQSVTGTVREENGKKYLTVTATGPWKGPKYPDRVMAGPVQPLVKLPVKPGLTIKLADALTDTLIYVPAGKFYMGNPLEQYPHWQEAPQHMVVLTKGFYMSDHPILNSEYAAVTGDATRNPKGNPADAACNMSCEMFAAYVKALEKLNPGKVIRAPSRAEWEYVAQSGTSDLSLEDNVGSRCGETMDRTVPVKSRKPNGWGFYGIVGADGSERSCDAAFYTDLICGSVPALVDPRYPTTKCQTTPVADHVHANGGASGYNIQELLNDNSNVGTELGGAQRNGRGVKLIRQRIVVEE